MTDRRAWLILGAGYFACVALVLYLTRDGVIWFDEQSWFVIAGDDVSNSLLNPYSGHLLLTTRLVFAPVLEIFGPDAAVFRIIGVATWWLCAALVFVFVKRRLGPEVALAPAFVLLFCGTAGVDLIGPGELPINLCLAGGLGALVVLDGPGESFPRDLVACLLLAFCLASWTAGLAFAAGVAVWLLVQRDWRRLWVPAIPLALYGLWYLIRHEARETEPTIQSDNLADLPVSMAEALAAGMTALSGLVIPPEAHSLLHVELTWGWPLAAIAVGLFVWRLTRGAIPKVVWGVLAVLLAYWVMLGLTAEPDNVRAVREPDLSRYAGISAAVLICLAAAAIGRKHADGRALAAFYAAAAVSITLNIIILADGADFQRGISDATRVEMEQIEATPDRDSLRGYLPALEGGELGVYAIPYLEAVDRYGSPLE